MPSFNDLKLLENYLKKQVGQSLNEKVRQDVGKVYKKNIQEQVYDVYDPIEYQRRLSLLRDENIRHNITDSGNEIILTVENDAKWNTIGHNPEPTQASLPELIEYGHEKSMELGYGNYDYPYYPQYLKPRPFTEKTIEEIFETKLHIKSLKEALKSKGLDIK